MWRDQTLTLHGGLSSVSSSSFPKAVVIIQTFHPKSIVSFEMGAVVGWGGGVLENVSLHRK